ncbi:MAG: L-2-amino-thiazoline-4-carboxylic acid hydrolase [Oscillospiraceae bacterium]|nr:L-2-amino-thiazoline-4-carboxylic acid hydrolase [Oscillospiraceae bacterium]
MKYGIMGVAVPLLVKKPAFAYLKETVLEINPKDVKSEYKRIIADQPEVGGMKNNLIMGLYLAAYFMAVYKVAPDKVSDEIFGEMVDSVCASEIFVKMNKGRDFFTEKNILTRYHLQNDPVFTENPENWHYTFSYDLDVPECTITYTKCAICQMARRENCFHLMPHLCKTDYAQQELMGNTLIRTKTIGNGDDICDFHIVGKK